MPALGGPYSRGVPGGDPPGWLMLRAVRILLECILVDLVSTELCATWGDICIIWFKMSEHTSTIAMPINVSFEVISIANLKIL